MSAPARFGRYRVERRIGSGAFATVWLAHDEVLEAPVAVKVLADNWAHRLDVRSRFEEEARILRRADSDRVVRVHDIGELEDGRPYFVMTYADRGTLADRLAGGSLPVPDALRYGADIARGLAVVHDVGVIHRDVNPGNVLLRAGREGAEERVLIADLGLAKAAARGSGFTLTVGTPGYMAPEQARPTDAGIDRRADVYSVGAVVHHMLTGVVPKQDVPPAPVRSLRPEVPAEVEAVVGRALATRPQDRYASASALADALDAAAAAARDAAPAAARPVPPLPPSLLPRPARFPATPPPAEPRSPGPEPDPAGSTVAEPGVAERELVGPGPAGEPVGSGPVGSGPAGEPVGSGPVGSGPAGEPVRSRPAGGDPAARAERLLEVERPVGPDDTLTIEWPQARRRRDRLIPLLVAVLVLGGGGTAAAVVLHNRADITVSSADGRMRITVPASWGRQLRQSAWDLDRYGQSGPDGTALLASADVSRWDDPTSTAPGVFVGRESGVPERDLRDYSAAASAGCNSAPAQPIQRSGLTGTTIRTVCAGRPVAYVQAVLTPPDDSFEVFVQVKEPASAGTAESVISTLVVDWNLNS